MIFVPLTFFFFVEYKGSDRLVCIRPINLQKHYGECLHEQLCYQILRTMRKILNCHSVWNVSIHSFSCSMHNLMTYHCLYKHLLGIVHSWFNPKGSTKTHYSNSCNSRACKPNFTQLTQKTINTLVFRFILFSHHVSVAASRSAKCLSLHWPVLVKRRLAVVF